MVRKMNESKLNILNYKGYYTKIHYSAEDEILYGKIEGIKSLVSFESTSVKEIKKEFQKAVDDYICYLKSQEVSNEK